MTTLPIINLLLFPSLLYIFLFPSHQFSTNTPLYITNCLFFSLVPLSLSLSPTYTQSRTHLFLLPFPCRVTQRKMSRRVSFSYDVNDMPIIYQKYADGNKKKIHEICSFGHTRKSEFSLYGFFRRTGAKAARALRCMSSRKRCSRKVSSASLARSHSYAETLDSQRVEAIEDCIEFFNSSSSLQRSNSVTSSC